MPVITRPVSDRVDVLTIWDNFERHCRELVNIGASAEEIAELRRAAEAVSVEEEAHARANSRNPAFNRRDLGEILEPYTCANGWQIRMPSKPAVRWAAMAILKTTGGTEPADNIGLLAAIVAGLHVLRLYSDGHSAEAMQLVSSPARLADLLPELMDASSGATLDDLAIDYTTLLGAEKKTPAATAYQALLHCLRQRCSAPSTTPSSPSTSRPGSPDLSHRGPNT
jgi:hypothetical protein